jgi:hypothetical protein
VRSLCHSLCLSLCLSLSLFPSLCLSVCVCMCLCLCLFCVSASVTASVSLSLCLSVSLSLCLSLLSDVSICAAAWWWLCGKRRLGDENVRAHRGPSYPASVLAAHLNGDDAVNMVERQYTEDAVVGGPVPCLNQSADLRRKCLHNSC